MPLLATITFLIACRRSRWRENSGCGLRFGVDEWPHKRKQNSLYEMAFFLSQTNFAEELRGKSHSNVARSLLDSA